MLRLTNYRSVNLSFILFELTVAAGNLREQRFKCFVELSLA